MELVKRVRNSQYMKNMTSGRYTITDEFPIRPSWCEAALCLEQIKREKAKGNKPALLVREYLQTFLFYLGWFIQRYFFIVLTLGTLIFILFGIGLVKIKIETNIEKLWVPRGGRLEFERDFSKKIGTQKAVDNNWTVIEDKTGISDDSATNFQVLIQNTRNRGENLLTRQQLLLHSEILQKLSTFTVETNDKNWTLADLCFKPKVPKLKGSLAEVVGTVLDNIVPCVIISPLDCFWEGSKPLGPLPPNDQYLGFQLAWTKLNPQGIMKFAETIFAGDDIDAAKDMFTRAGITTAYQYRQCVDPLDPGCPTTAKNYVNFCPIVEKFIKWNEEHGNRYSLPNPNKTNEHKTGKFNESSLYDDYYDPKPTNSKTTKKPSGGGNGAGAGGFLDIFGGGDDAEDEPVSTNICDYAPLTDAIKDIFYKDEALARTFIPGIWTNYGEKMTGGCAGLATEFMQWPEQLIIGGITHGPNGTILSAEGLQSILMIANHNDLYSRYADPAKYNLTDWSPKSALGVIKTWQRKYSKIIYDWPNNTLPPRRIVHPLAAASLEDMVNEFSQFNPWFIIIGYALMVIYACLSAFSFAKKGVRSCCGLAFAGCFIVLLANISGLGCTLLIGIDFNATTTQILPFLLLSLGVDEMFLLLNKYREIVTKINNNELAVLLRETGLSVLITYVNNILAFLAGGLLPIPALKIFCIQVAVVLVFNLVAIITLFPAIMALDLIRQRNGYVDILCCIRGERVLVNNPLSQSSPVTYYNGDTIEMNKKSEAVNGTTFDHEPIKKKKQKCTLTHFVRNVYAPIIQKLSMKIIVVIVFVGVMIGAIVGLFRIPIGLELSEIVPAGTAPHAFLVAREEYFPFYPIYTVIRGPEFDFSTKKNQKLMRDFMDELKNISYVVKMRMKSDWLHMMTTWLEFTQKHYDIDNAFGAFNGSNSYKPSRMGLIASKLICHKGVVNASCDRNDSSCQNKGRYTAAQCQDRLNNIRLLDNDRYINEEGFYSYLTAWYNVDQMTYYVSQANFYPSPPAWDHESTGPIPAANRLIFSQMAIFIDGLYNTDTTLDMINKIRAVTEKYASLGLPVFPLGIPFTFWELYLYLTQSLLIAFAIIIVAVFIAITIMLINPWIAALIVVVLMLMIIVELGFMGLIHIKLNPISAVTLITAVGIRVKFTVHVALSFLTTVGTRNERVARTLEHMFIPVLHGGISTLVGLIMLAFSKFEFILMYYFLIMFALVVLGILSGLILMPVILSWIGPPSEVIPLNGSSYLQPPDNYDRDNKTRSPDTVSPTLTPWKH